LAKSSRFPRNTPGFPPLGAYGGGRFLRVGDLEGAPHCLALGRCETCQQCSVVFLAWRLVLLFFYNRAVGLPSPGGPAVRSRGVLLLSFRGCFLLGKITILAFPLWAASLCVGAGFRFAVLGGITFWLHAPQIVLSFCFSWGRRPRPFSLAGLYARFPVAKMCGCDLFSPGASFVSCLHGFVCAFPMARRFPRCRPSVSRNVHPPSLIGFPPTGSVS